MVLRLHPPQPHQLVVGDTELVAQGSEVLFH